MKAIFIQYYRQKKSVMGLQMYKNGRSVLFQSNEFFDDETLYNTLRTEESKIEEMFVLVSEKFLSDPNTQDIFTSYENQKKFVLLSHDKIKKKFNIRIKPISEIYSYLNVLCEKILHQNCKSEKELIDRIKLVELLIYSYNFHSLIYDEESLKPVIKDFIDNNVKNFELNYEKKEALSLFHDFLEHKGHAFYILTGPAGTGKTTLVKFFLEFYKNKCGLDNFLLLAPTGKAARVLEQKTKLKCHTIHKSIYRYKYSTEVITNTLDVAQPEKGKTDVIKQLDLFEDSELVYQDDYRIILNQFMVDSPQLLSFVVIDESSMVTDYSSKYELEIYHEKSLKLGRIFHDCSGFHLNDVIRYLQKVNRYVKIVLVGDLYQLPPISDRMEKFIPALDKKFLRKKYRDFTIFDYELNESFRFANEEIYLLSMFLRREYIEKAFKKGKMNVNFKYDFNQLIKKFKYINPEVKLNEFRSISEMLFSVKNDIQNGLDNIIITFRNATSKYINNELRYLLGRRYVIENNDKLICVKNSHNNSIMNGEQFTVTELKGVHFKYVINLPAGISCTLPFYNVNVCLTNSSVVNNFLVVLDSEELYYPPDLKIDNINRTYQNFSKVEYLIDREFKSRMKYIFFLNVKETVKTYFEDKSLNNDWNQVRKIEALINKTEIKKSEEVDEKLKLNIVLKEFKEDFNNFVIMNLSTDKYLNSVVCNYGFSITCHKAQGSEWSNVYITDFNYNDICWLYTALTRAKHSVSFLGTRVEVSQCRFNFKPFFRLLRNFKGEIFNVQDIRIISKKEISNIISSNYFPVNLPEKIEISNEIVNVSDNFVLVEAAHSYYYFQFNLLSDDAFEKFKNLKLDNKKIKISFKKNPDEKMPKATVMELV